MLPIPILATLLVIPHTAAHEMPLVGSEGGSAVLSRYPVVREPAPGSSCTVSLTVKHARGHALDEVGCEGELEDLVRDAVDDFVFEGIQRARGQDAV